MYLLDSGFTPQNCAVLKEKLSKVIKTSIASYVKAYRIDVPMSLTAFIVPGMSNPLTIFVVTHRRILTFRRIWCT